MKENIRIWISIVISAVLLGMVVSYCAAGWMPADSIDWILWGAMVLVGFFAVFRIANLAKMLGSKDNE